MSEGAEAVVVVGWASDDPGDLAGCEVLDSRVVDGETLGLDGVERTDPAPAGPRATRRAFAAAALGPP